MLPTTTAEETTIQATSNLKFKATTEAATRTATRTATPGTARVILRKATHHDFGAEGHLAASLELSPNSRGDAVAAGDRDGHFPPHQDNDATTVVRGQNALGFFKLFRQCCYEFLYKRSKGGFVVAVVAAAVAVPGIGTPRKVQLQGVWSMETRGRHSER